jgi:hypothetical protein
MHETDVTKIIKILRIQIESEKVEKRRKKNVLAYIQKVREALPDATPLLKMKLDVVEAILQWDVQGVSSRDSAENILKFIDFPMVGETSDKTFFEIDLS